jgi:hypothetical protein
MRYAIKTIIFLLIFLPTLIYGHIQTYHHGLGLGSMATRLQDPECWMYGIFSFILVVIWWWSVRNET